MTYAVKEVYFTLQGEGQHQGRPSVFVRFAGCNMWTGLEKDRATALCRFCDTEFVGTDGPGGGPYATPDALATKVAATWPSFLADEPFVVCTGGEPLLQLDPPLIAAFHRRGFTVAIETNGTIPVPEGVDWICVSPKARGELVVTSGHELKLVYPQEGAEPERFRNLDFQYFSLQPMDGPDRDRHTALVHAYVETHPEWRVSLQMHKLVGLP
jgi:7-carboxy-7-deazaguanine synthase